MIIYKITNNITNQCYIGQTINFKKRKNGHLDLYKNKNLKGAQRPMYKDMRKYGIENFTFKILEECNENCSNEREVYYMNKFNSIKKGYNHEKSGKHKFHSEETKRKISDSQLGNKNHMYDKKGINCKNSKKVINLTTKKTYNSMRECAIDEYGDIKYVKYISRICQPNTNRFFYKGNTYRLLDENGNIIDKNVNKKS